MVSHADLDLDALHAFFAKRHSTVEPLAGTVMRLHDLLPNFTVERMAPIQAVRTQGGGNLLALDLPGASGATLKGSR